MSVVAVSSGSASMVSTTGVTPAADRSGSRYCLRATWSEARFPATTPTFLPARRPELRPQSTTAWRMVDWSGPVHQRYGRALVGPVGHRGPLADEGGVTLLGDAQLVVAGPVALPVEHGEGGRRSLGPGLAQGPHGRLVGRVEHGDDGIDLPAVDPPGVVDLFDEQQDGLGLLPELDVRGESLLAGQGVQRDQGEHDVDGVSGHPARRGAGAAHRAGRRAGGAGGQPGRSTPPADVLDGAVATHVTRPISTTPTMARVRIWVDRERRTKWPHDRVTPFSGFQRPLPRTAFPPPSAARAVSSCDASLTVSSCAARRWAPGRMSAVAPVG